MIEYMLITADPALARHAVAAGVDRIFVDLEIRGKLERQKNRDTLISRHTLADVEAVRSAIPGHELLVRVDPWFDGTPAQVEAAIAAGADLVMLPMCQERAEVETVVGAARGRARVVLLVETPQAMTRFRELLVEGVDEVYIGLNDLHLALGLDFMFEPLAGGLVDHLAAQALERGIPFGFGGIARMGEGLVSAERILAEHLRLGSTRLILSRTFLGKARTLAELEDSGADLGAELGRLRAVEEQLAKRSERKREEDRRALANDVWRVAADLRARRAG